MKKLLVSGAGGFVGARIMTQLAGRYELCAFPKGMPAAADEQTVADWVRREQPDVIVHTAALSDTGYSEKHPDESYRANVLLPCWMAAAAQKSGAKLVAFSSDQVYTGLTEHGPFDEDTPLSPANVYGRHKQEMEQRVLDILPDAVLLRAAWMYDLPGYGLPIRGNFLLNLLTAAMRQETLRFSMRDYRGITYVREAVVCSAAVAISGIISFVGLIIPHILRVVTGPGHRRLMPLSFVAGAAFMTLTDLLARTLAAPISLPIGVFTSILGAPFFLWIYRHGQCRCDGRRHPRGQPQRADVGRKIQRVPTKLGPIARPVAAVYQFHSAFPHKTSISRTASPSTRASRLSAYIMRLARRMSRGSISRSGSPIVGLS